MTLAELSDPNAVTQAMDEFDRLGRDAFLRKYGFGRSRNYFVERDGTLYDSKAIAGVAYGIEHPNRGPLRPEEFIGGDATVRPKLEELGFVVRARDSEPSAPFSEIMRRVLELQSSYSKDGTTPEMQLRGRLIKQEGPRALQPLLSAISGLSYQPEVEGGDGSGSKARVPWILIFDRQRYERSPLRWYVAYLFAADGSAAYLSVHLSSARSEDGKYRAMPTAFRQERVSWARKMLQLDWEVQQMALHDPAGLGPFWEQGSVVAICYNSEAIPDDEQLQVDLGVMLARLDVIYENHHLAPIPPDESSSSIGPRVATPLEELAAVTYLDRTELLELEHLLEDKRQLVLEGPPGSGKTFLADHFARYFAGLPLQGAHDERVETVQFHQSYGYEDFVQGIRPVTNEHGQLQYHVLPGIFMRMCDLADRNPDRRFVLIIDEINRGNLSRIFGELLLLLEYRDKRVRLPYGAVDGKDDQAYLSIPRNLYLIGTMNSTDRSLALIDYALRRRFYFYRLLPVVDGQAPVLERWLTARGVGEQDRQRVVRLFVKLNREVEHHLGSEFQIGHSYFMREDIGTDGGLDRLWRRSIMPLLEEYLHGARDREVVLADLAWRQLLAIGLPEEEPATGEPDEVPAVVAPGDI